MDGCGLDVAETCRLSNGEPCTPCRRYIDLETLLTSGVAYTEATQGVGHVESENKRRLLSEMNDQHDPLISRLPSEIISHIFLFTLNRKEAKGFADYVIDSPLYLGRICQSWRHIAWSAPPLWNWIHIILRLPSPSDFEVLVKGWLDRAGNLPLTIHINYNEVDDEYFFGSENRFGNFIDHINQRSRFWEDVSFKVPSGFSKFITGSSEGSPNLRVLRAQSTDPGDFEWVLEGPPSQPSYMAFSCWKNDTLTTIGVDWTNLTTAYISYIRSSECIHLLHHAPSLVLADFDNVYFEDDTSMVDTPVFVHRSLQIFVLKSAGAENVERELFLDSFTFPQLSKLRLHFIARPTRVSRLLWRNSIQPFIVRSSSRLTELLLEVPFTSKLLIDTLGTIPSLQVLILNMALQAEAAINRSPGGLHGLLVHIHAWKSKNEEDGSPFTKFLPKLTRFMYYGPGGFQSDLDLPWMEFMDILGPLSEIRNPHRHPQDRMALNLGPMFPLATFHTSLNYDIFEDFGHGNTGSALRTSLLEHLNGNDVVILEWNYSPFKANEFR